MVILWATSMVDTDSSNYAEMVKNDYNIRNAVNETSTLHWWHGDGLLLDYTNEDAVQWWQGALDNVLKLGIDGWKVDGTDPFIMEYLVPEGKHGPVSYREYANDYYRHFLEYSRSTNGPHCLIMSRPVDSYNIIGAEVQVYLDFSPRDVVFSGWVGDQDPTFDGMQDALRNMLHSGWNNYTAFGSDIGGYRTGDGPLGRTAELFLRWAQMGAFLPLMENGGDKEHRPWAFDEPGSTTVVDAYRALVAAHYELQPYLLSHGAEAYENNGSLILPAEPRPQDEQDLIQYNNFSTYDYSLGPSIFVHPVTAANTTTATVHLPATPSGKGWFDWFDRNRTYASNATVTVAAPLTKIPVFGRQGDIVPLHVSTRYTARGSPRIAGSLTLAVHSPIGWERAAGPAAVSQAQPVSLQLREHMAPDARVQYEVLGDRGNATLRVLVEPVGRDVRLLLDGLQGAQVPPGAVAVAVGRGRGLQACAAAEQASRRASFGEVTSVSNMQAWADSVESDLSVHEMAKPWPLSRLTTYNYGQAQGQASLQELPEAFKTPDRQPVMLAPRSHDSWWAFGARGEGDRQAVSQLDVWAGAADSGLCVEIRVTQL